MLEVLVLTRLTYTGCDRSCFRQASHSAKVTSPSPFGSISSNAISSSRPLSFLPGPGGGRQGQFANTPSPPPVRVEDLQDVGHLPLMH